MILNSENVNGVLSTIDQINLPSRSKIKCANLFFKNGDVLQLTDFYFVEGQDTLYIYSEAHVSAIDKALVENIIGERLYW